jgi:hypothetical protein
MDMQSQRRNRMKCASESTGHGNDPRPRLSGAPGEFESAEASKEAAQANVRIAQEKLGYTELHAGFDGVIVATKAGTEKNATVFARFFVQAFQDPAADVDKNESVSALEAFQYAERKTNEYYTSQKRLATEHAVFEDTGKGEAVRAASADGAEGRLLASLTLVRFGDAQKAAFDPAKRDLLAKKEDLERRIDVLKYQKAAMTQNNYEQQLKALLVELARVQATLDK